MIWDSEIPLKRRSLFCDPRCCTWVAIGIGGATALTSATLSAVAASKQQAAINAARSAEVSQQAALQQRTQALSNKSIAQSTAPVAKQQMQTGQDQRTALFDALQKSSVPIAAANPIDGSGRTTATGNAWTNLVAGNQAKVGSYSDWENEQAQKNADIGQKIGIQNSFSQGTAALLPIQLQVANQAGDQLSGWGNIVGALGKAASAYGVASAYSGAAGTAGGAAGGATTSAFPSDAYTAQGNAMINNIQAGGGVGEAPVWNFNP
jgi:hypothetical protein